MSGTQTASSTGGTVLVLFEGKAYTFDSPSNADWDENGNFYVETKNGEVYVFSGTYMVRY